MEINNRIDIFKSSMPLKYSGFDIFTCSQSYLDIAAVVKSVLTDILTRNNILSAEQELIIMKISATPVEVNILPCKSVRCFGMDLMSFLCPDEDDIF